MRQIVLDTETTGLEPTEGHRIIEIGCVELVRRRLTGNNYHQYLQPDREIDSGAVEVHGITTEFLGDKPRFADIVEDLLAYLKGAELIIHNAPFDVGFINHELALLKGDYGRLEDDNSQRDLHGALLDAEILADVYLAMTGGQVKMAFSTEEQDAGAGRGCKGEAGPESDSRHGRGAASS